MEELTAREVDVLAFVRGYVKQYDCAPTRREIGQALGISRVTAELHLQRICGKGHIKLRKQWRGIFLKEHKE